MGKPVKKICEHCDKEYWGQKESRFCSLNCVGLHASWLCKSGKEVCKTQEEREKDRIKRINANFVNREVRKPRDPLANAKLDSSHLYKKKEPALMKRFNACRG
jgi:hypothetical protein